MNPSFFAPIVEPLSERPKLLMVVDTEEEFDWSAPFARENVGVTAIAELGRLQAVVEPHGLKPTYVCDFPVASTSSSSSILGELASRGVARIGAHLHPWVTPPFDEPLVPKMSFGCNLEATVERAKITQLTEAIVRNMNVTPKVYKAGRYGFGYTTADTIEALNFTVDASVLPHMDFTSEWGPTFMGHTATPSTFGRSRKMLELPCTSGFIGFARKAGEPIHRLASAGWLRPTRAVGILARTAILNKVLLSPEGNTLEEMRALTRALYSDGLRTFTMTLHSPTLKPACTRYARTDSERDDFLKTIAKYCEFFFGEMNGRPTTAEGLYKDLLGN